MRGAFCPVVVACFAACGRTESPAPQPAPQAPAQDPWAQPAQPAAPDPWAASGTKTAPPPAAPPSAPAHSAPARPTPAPPPTSALPAGQYPCWLSGMGNYTASVLGTFTFGADGAYHTTSAPGGGTYRVDGARVVLAGGKLDGWVGAIEAPGGTLRVRFRADTPGDPGTSIKIGDHVCTLHR